MIKRYLSIALIAGVSVLAVSCGGNEAKPTADVAKDASKKVENMAKPAVQNQVNNAKKAAQVEATGNAKFEFTEDVWDFGTIKSGDVVNHVFNFKNTGTEPLIISNAKGSCGCTAPNWPKEPIAPGESGVIKVVFNSRGKSNKQNKLVTITANTTPNQTRLRVTGNVEKAPATNAAAVKK